MYQYRENWSTEALQRSRQESGELRLRGTLDDCSLLANYRLIERLELELAEKMRLVSVHW